MPRISALGPLDFDDSAPRGARRTERAQLARMLRAAGGRREEFRAERAGPFGCDPCWDCRRRPAEGELVWQNCYGDLYCDSCAARRATLSEVKLG